MRLQDRIVAYVTSSNGLVSLEKLIDKGQSVGFSESEVLAALSEVGKRLKAVARGNQLYYQVPPTPKPTSTSHLTWVNQHYPPMTPDNDGSGIEIDLSWLFLKTKDERDAFKAEMSGRPLYTKSKYAKKK